MQQIYLSSCKLLQYYNGPLLLLACNEEHISNTFPVDYSPNRYRQYNQNTIEIDRHLVTHQFHKLDVANKLLIVLHNKPDTTCVLLMRCQLFSIFNAMQKINKILYPKGKVYKTNLKNMKQNKTYFLQRDDTIQSFQVNYSEDLY